MAPTKQRNHNDLHTIPQRRKTKKPRNRIQKTQNTILPKTRKTHTKTNTHKGSERMSFNSINGLIESTNFSDFWRWCTANPNKLNCPACDKQCKITHFFTGLMGMYLTGYAAFECTDQECEFNKTNFRIQAIPKSERVW